MQFASDFLVDLLAYVMQFKLSSRGAIQGAVACGGYNERSLKGNESPMSEPSSEGTRRTEMTVEHRLIAMQVRHHCGAACMLISELARNMHNHLATCMMAEFGRSQWCHRYMNCSWIITALLFSQSGCMACSDPVILCTVQ